MKIIIIEGPGGPGNGSNPVEYVFEDSVFVSGLPPIGSFPGKDKLSPTMQEFWEKRRHRAAADASRLWAKVQDGEATEVAPGYFVV